MKNIILLTTVAAFSLVAGVASAGPVTGTDKTDTKVVVDSKDTKKDGKIKKISHESKTETKTEATPEVKTPDVKADVKTDVKSDVATTVPSKVETPAPVSTVVPESK